MPTQKIKINRAPVLTLWAAIVAERWGYDHNAALTLGKAVAGLNAQSKGQRLGIYEPRKETKKERGGERQAPQEDMVQLMGRAVPITETKDGIRAVIKGKPIEPEGVERYLHGKFGDALPEVQKAMEKLARSRKPQELMKSAYQLYESFRPEIPEGTKGWGARGELDINLINRLAK